MKFSMTASYFLPYQGIYCPGSVMRFRYDEYLKNRSNTEF
jgi:hypothetical protein